MKTEKTPLQIWIDKAINTSMEYLETINDFKINDKEKISKSVAIAFKLLHKYLTWKKGIKDDAQKIPWAREFNKYINGNEKLFKSLENTEVQYDFTDIYKELYNLYDAYVNQGKHSKIQNAEKNFIDTYRPVFFKWIKNDTDIQRLKNIFNTFKNRQFTTSVLAADDKTGSENRQTNFRAETIFHNNTNSGDTQDTQKTQSDASGLGKVSFEENKKGETPRSPNGPSGEAEKKMANILAPFNKRIFNINSQKIYKELSADRNYDFAEEFKQFDDAITHLESLKDTVDDAKEKLPSLRKENIDKAKKSIQPAINEVIKLKSVSSKIFTDLHKVDFITERAAYNAAEKIINNMIKAQSIVGNLGINLSWASRPTWRERQLSNRDYIHRTIENIKNNTVRSSRLIHDAVAWNDAKQANDYAKRMKKEWPGEEGEKRAKEFISLYTSKDPKDVQRCRELIIELEEKEDSKILPVKIWKGVKSLFTKKPEDERTKAEKEEREEIKERIKRNIQRNKQLEKEREEKRKENERIDKELKQAQKKREETEEREKKKMAKNREAIYKEADRAFKKSIFDKIKGKIK